MQHNNAGIRTRKRLQFCQAQLDAAQEPSPPRRAMVAAVERREIAVFVAIGF